MDDIDRHCVTTPPLAGARVDWSKLLMLPVLAKFSEDDGWYRAIVTGQFFALTIHQNYIGHGFYCCKM